MLNNLSTPNGTQQNLGWPPCWKWSLVLAADNLTTRCFGSNRILLFLFAVILSIFDEDSVFRFEAKRRLRRRYFLSTWHFPYEQKNLTHEHNLSVQPVRSWIRHIIKCFNESWPNLKPASSLETLTRENVIWKIKVVVWWFSLDVADAAMAWQRFKGLRKRDHYVKRLK